MMTVRVDVDQLLQLLPILTRSVGALDRCDDVTGIQISDNLDNCFTAKTAVQVLA